AALRRGAARAYRGLGTFLGALGVLTLLNLRMLCSVVHLNPQANFYAHEIATALYPIGFVEFILATFGDSSRELLRRGRTLFLGYCALAWVLHFTGVLDMGAGRAPITLFVLVFAVQGTLLAAKRGRAGD